MTATDKEAFADVIVQHTPVLIIGAGLSGMAAATQLKEHAITVEREPSAGGLVRSTNENGYWFDHVLHLLYFNCAETEQRIKSLLGDDLANCNGEAWVQALSGRCRFPIQMHLNGLPDHIVRNCLNELRQISESDQDTEPDNFADWLRFTFGETLCNEFMFPYNNKMWKRPLDSLVPANFKWNITRPDFEQVLKGADKSGRHFDAYNANGWYPRPAIDSPIRGMGYLSHALANQVEDLRLNHEVSRIDLENKTATIRNESATVHVRYDHCLITCPLPTAATLCPTMPSEIAQGLSRLKTNRVVSIALNIKGPRPQDCGLWCYYADPSICFTRLIFMHQFDPRSAPDDGWGLLVELVQRGEDPEDDENLLIERVINDIHAVNMLTDDQTIIASKVMTLAPAYVVFSDETQTIVKQAAAHLLQHDIQPLGRYGRWEYSSMSQVMTDGFEAGTRLAQKIDA